MLTLNLLVRLVFIFPCFGALAGSIIAFVTFYAQHPSFGMNQPWELGAIFGFLFGFIFGSIVLVPTRNIPIATVLLYLATGTLVSGLALCWIPGGANGIASAVVLSPVGFWAGFGVLMRNSDRIRNKSMPSVKVSVLVNGALTLILLAFTLGLYLHGNSAGKLEVGMNRNEVDSMFETSTRYQCRMGKNLIVYYQRINFLSIDPSGPEFPEEISSLDEIPYWYDSQQVLFNETGSVIAYTHMGESLEVATVGGPFRGSSLAILSGPFLTGESDVPSRRKGVIENTGLRPFEFDSDGHRIWK